jgi:curli biogenesis system outer membrane secretion channel CsgG
MPTLRHRSQSWLAALALASLSLSCAPAIRVYVNPQADLAFYTKIAVLPFSDISANPMASPRVTRAFVTELIMTNRFQVIQPEEFVGALRRMGVQLEQDGTYDPDKLKDAASRMGVTGVLRGAVTEYEMTRNSGGEIPILAFDAELVDVGTGDVVWRSSISKRGKGRVPVFGSKPRSLGRLTQDACAELVARLRRKAL